MILMALGLVSSSRSYSQGDPAASFSWPEGKEAAVCLTYDDGLDCHLDVAAPALESHNLRGTFYCTGHSQSLHDRTEE